MSLDRVPMEYHCCQVSMPTKCTIWSVMTANGVHGDDDDDRSLNENAATAAQQLLAAVKVATPVRAWSSSHVHGRYFRLFLFREIQKEAEETFFEKKSVYTWLYDSYFEKINFRFSRSKITEVRVPFQISHKINCY